MHLRGDAETYLTPPRLGLARGRGDASVEAVGSVVWIVIEGGEGVLRAAGTSVPVGGRRDVFERAGWSVTVAAGDRVEVRGDLRWTVVWRPGRGGRTRILDPAGVQQEERGSGADRRMVRTYLAEGRIIGGETINAPGGWSSYPPHRHEHEEVYLYRFSDPAGFGLALEYDEAREEARRVVDGSVQRIRTGYHPVVSAPGYAMYYLWALAGERDVLAPELDPAHAGRG